MLIFSNSSSKVLLTYCKSWLMKRDQNILELRLLFFGQALNFLPEFAIITFVSPLLGRPKVSTDRMSRFLYIFQVLP